MARKRVHNLELPEKVYKTKTSYVYKPDSKTTITLGKIRDLSLNDVETQVESIKTGKIPVNSKKITFNELWSLYLASPAYIKLSKRTKDDKSQEYKNLKKVFGHVTVNYIKPEHVRKYMDLRGLQSETQANHELSSMSVAFTWGRERGYCRDNPCTGIKKFEAIARENYPEDEEYYFLFNVARPAVKIAMEIAYLCGARIGDIIKITHEQLRNDGIYIKQGKTRVKQIKIWTERLEAIIEYAKTIFPPSSSKSPLILNMEGNRYTYKTFNTHWNEDKQAAEDKAGYTFNFHFHDLKAKGITDFEGDRKQFSGHKTESQVEVYVRKPRRSPTLDLPKISKI